MIDKNNNLEKEVMKQEVRYTHLLITLVIHEVLH